MKLMVGADPEVFMKKGGKFVSAHGAIPGTKEEPYKVDDGAVQVDGMALEFNIDPANNQKEFIDNLSSVMKKLKVMVGNQADSIVACPVAPFGQDYIDAQPVEAKEMGCDPDYNAWNDGKVNDKPDGGLGFRTGAGHIHLGWTEGQDINNPEHIEACIMMTKQLDVYLGIPSLLFDSDTERRELYGKAGAFRPKPYGVEYRVLSNKWLTSRKLKAFVYRQTKRAFRDLLRGCRMYEDISAWRMINNSSVPTAERYIDYYGITSNTDREWLLHEYVR